MTSTTSRCRWYRPEDAREDLLGIGATAGAIAAADPARDDGGPQGLLGAPIRGLQIGLDEEAEQGRQLDGPVTREALDVGDRADLAERL
jgi:hypothetical protein